MQSLGASHRCDSSVQKTVPGTFLYQEPTSLFKRVPGTFFEQYVSGDWHLKIALAALEIATLFNLYTHCETRIKPVEAILPQRHALVLRLLRLSLVRASQ